MIGRQKFLGLLGVVVFVLVIAGCSKDSGEKSKSISGSVLLDGENDHSGIEILFYADNGDDSDVQTALNEHSNLGPQTFTASAFDHRLGTLIKSTTTTANGAFSISGLSAETYNVVVYKSGYGCRYYTHWNVASSWPSDVVLYPEQSLAGAIETAFTFQTGHHYVVTGNLYFQYPATVTIQPGSWIRIAANKSVNFLCPVTFPLDTSTPFHVTSNDQFDTTTGGLSAESMVPYFAFNITSESSVSDGTISGGVFSWGMTALATECENTTVEECAFQYCSTGFSVNTVEQTTIQNLLCRDCSTYGIDIEDVTTGSVSHNILLRNDKGIYATSDFIGTIDDNWFSANEFGLYTIQSMGIVRNNEFYRSTTGDFSFQLNNQSTTVPLQIQHNLFTSGTALYTVRHNTFSHYYPITVEENNFESADWFFYNTYNALVEDDVLTFTDNYFDGLTTEAAVRARLMDASTHGEAYPTIVLDGICSSPYASSIVGIQ